MMLKHCVQIDKPFYGGQAKRAFPPPKSRLISSADAFEIKYVPYLLAYANVIQNMPLPVELNAEDKELLVNIAASGKEVTFHGGGIIQDHVYCGGDDRGFDAFEWLRFVSFASFALYSTSRITNVINGEWFADSKSALSPEEWLAAFRQRMEMIRKHFGGGLAFENAPLSADYERLCLQKYMCDPFFISDIFREIGGIYFLLDLAHAKVSAPQFCMTTEDYLMRLPLDKIAEIHVSGTGWSDGKIIETHSRPLEEDLKLLQWLFSRGVKPRYIVVEDFKSPEPELVEEYKALKEQISSL